MVHAYDMNMGVPDTPLSALDEEPGEGRPVFPGATGQHSDTERNGHDLNTSARGHKRRKESATWSGGNVAKLPATKSTRAARSKELATVTISDVETNHAPLANTAPPGTRDRETDAGPTSPVSQGSLTNSPPSSAGLHVVPGLRNTNLRNVLQYVINDSLKVGGRPESAIAYETDGGEKIEVRVRHSSGAEDIKLIEWYVEPQVPETMLGK